MPIAMIYWIIMLLWLIFGLWTYWPSPDRRIMGGHFLLWLLLFLLGWEVFGFPIKG